MCETGPFLRSLQISSPSLMNPGRQWVSLGGYHFCLKECKLPYVFPKITSTLRDSIFIWQHILTSRIYFSGDFKLAPKANCYSSPSHSLWNWERNSSMNLCLPSALFLPACKHLTTSLHHSFLNSPINNSLVEKDPPVGKLAVSKVPKWTEAKWAAGWQYLSLHQIF